MARKSRLTAGTVIDQWTLKQYLGGGGNAEVWAAVAQGDSVALKVLTRQATNPASEPYARFQNEIAAMKTLRGQSGVLPLLGHWDSSTGRRPWLAVPIATRFVDALEDAEVERMVEAVATVAHTLADIASEHGMHHRDIKPDNLFLHDKGWCVGDFGLVALPTSSFQTAEGTKLGPLHFIAPEMLNQSSRDAGAADVFSLAKTLWVTITAQNFPLPGHMRRDEPMCLLSTYRSQGELRELESLIEVSTRFNPADRPTMREFAAQLDAWRGPPVLPAPAPSLDAVRRRIGPTLQSHAERETAMRVLRDHVQEMLNDLTASVHNLSECFTRGTGIVPEREFAGFSGFDEEPGLAELRDRDHYYYSTHRALIAHAVRAKSGLIDSVQWYSGFAIGATLSGKLKIKAAHVIRDKEKSRTLWIAEEIVQAETPLESEVVTSLVDRLIQSLPQVLPELEKAVDC